VGVFCIPLWSMGSRFGWVVQGRVYRIYGTRLSGCGSLGWYDYLVVVLALCGCVELPHVVVAATAVVHRVLG
jgi:hypothetical protein